MVETPRLQAKKRLICVAMRRYQIGSHTKTDLKVHIVWFPKYRKGVLTGQVAVRTRDVLRQIAMEHELDIISGKVSTEVVKQNETVLFTN